MGRYLVQAVETQYMDKLTLTILATFTICSSQTDNSNNVLNIFMTGDWGGPRETLAQDETLPPQDKYGFSISYSMNEMVSEVLPDSILLLGDNIYSAGVYDENDGRFTDTYLATFDKPNLRTVPMYAIAGNHEYHRNVSALIAYTSVDPTSRWNYPNYWYSVSYLDGRVLQLMIDTSAL